MKSLGWIVLSLSIALPSLALSQTPLDPASSLTEANLRDFDFLVHTIEVNYAGFDTKVTDAYRAQLDQFTASIRTQVASAQPEETLALYQQWLAFFHDAHTRIAANSTDSPDLTPAPTLAWTEATVQQRLSQPGRQRDPVEGIWQIGPAQYTIGILRTGTRPDRFTAVVLATTSSSWSAGEIKAEITRQPNGQLKMLYRNGTHAPSTVTVASVMDGAALALDGGRTHWARVWPKPKDPDAFARHYAGPQLFLKRISATTLWLRLPEMGDAQAQPLRDLLRLHRAELEHTPNLILDLRDNPGGSDYVYQPLLPYLCSRPTYSIGIELRATEENIRLRRAVADRVRTEAPQEAAELDAQIKLMSRHLGEYVQPDPLPFSITPCARNSASPKRIALLIDGAASSAEQLILDARQSHKVTLFGKHNSAGVLDFANVVSLPTPSGRFEFQWATSRSLRLPNDPVDPDGIVPDITIPATQQDSIQYVVNRFNRQAVH